MSEQYHTLKKQRYLALVQECARSGKPKRAWCQENKVPYSTFMRWQKQLREEAAGQLLAQRPEEACQIVPLHIRLPTEPAIPEPPAEPEAFAGKEILIQKEGLRLTLPAGTAAEYLICVVRGLL